VGLLKMAGRAYDVFKNAPENSALQVVITPAPAAQNRL
jgi:hypothetical protein